MKKLTGSRMCFTSYVSDLRMEIADTDKFEFREGLKKREQFLNDVIGRLQ